MQRSPFKLWHSLAFIVVLLVVQGVITYIAPATTEWTTLVVGVVASVVILYVATEVIEEVRNARHMLVLLSVVVGEFLVVFAIEYGLLVVVSPSSFPTLPHDAIALLLQSTMVFVFNPLYTPETFVGRALLLENSLGALGLILFVLQNIWQFRRGAIITRETGK